MYYVITFGKQGKRGDERFLTKKKALTFAKKMVKLGKEMVFMDTYDKDDDLLDYKEVK